MNKVDAKIRFPKTRDMSSVAKSILKKRYYGEGEKEWRDIVDRVVNTVCKKWKDEDKRIIYEMILNTYFVPNSPCLVNAGKPDSGLVACFVVDFPDTIEGIFKTKLDFALIARKGGGCGTTLSKIRPEGASVAGSTHGYAGGPVKFADTISHDADALTQAGFRSMAIMFSCSIYHPDIIKFINAKQEEGRIANANISVVVDNNFMEAVRDGKKYWTEFDGKKYKEYDAKTVFDMIVEGMWRNGEPGLLFKDRIDDSPYKYTGQEILGTNPCSEQPLPINGQCNLGSLDLSKFINQKGDINWQQLELAVRTGIKFLDSVVDASGYPTPEIKKWAKENRAVGMGVMGFADLCLIKKIAYGSEESIKLLEEIMEFISEKAIGESIELGKTPWYKKLILKSNTPKMCKKLPAPRRNITVTTVAPTGTISLIAGCSSGIEPIFSEIIVRNDKTGTYTFENDLASQPYFRCAVSANGAEEVTWEEHVAILASAQKYVDSGISKTINFPQGTHRDTIGKAAFLAWESGCKGVAMYRNNSRKAQVLTPKNLKKQACPVCGGEIVDLNGKKKCTTCTKELIEDTSTYYD